MHLDAKYKDQAQKKPLALEEFDDLIGEYCVRPFSVPSSLGNKKTQFTEKIPS